jgi:hypothetical protein
LPIEGAEVRVAGQHGTTNGEGYYSLPGVPVSYGGASAIKSGYAIGRVVLTISGDTRFDFQLGAPIAIYTLSGVVSEETPTGLVPIEGVRVDEYSCEEVSPSPPFFGNACPVVIVQTTTTDTSGRYRVSGLYSGRNNSISVSKEGFEDPRADPNPPDGDPGSDPPLGEGWGLTIDGDTRLDLRLVRRRLPMRVGTTPWPVSGSDAPSGDAIGLLPVRDVLTLTNEQHCQSSCEPRRAAQGRSRSTGKSAPGVMGLFGLTAD